MSSCYFDDFHKIFNNKLLLVNTNNKKVFNQNDKLLLYSISSLKFFLRNVFNTLNPSTKIIWNWHIDYLCDVLEEVYLGKIKRVIINIPPRYLKSIICSVAFPAWVLGKDPTKRIIVCSYSKTLAVKHSIDTRQVMQSEWYKQCFPNTQISHGKNEKTKFITTKNGFRFATSTGGTLTGEGGDILIIDDPHNPVNIFNKKNRIKVANWFSSVFSSRLNNKKTGSIIVVMQRLHNEDLCGYLLDKKNNKNKWFHINIPAIAENEITYQLYDKIYKIRQVGNILHKKMEGEDELNNIKSDLGEYNFLAQYQQNPISAEGNLIKKKWLKYFNLDEFLKEMNGNDICKNYYISIDCAAGIGTENDFSAIAVFLVKNNKFYLCNIYNLKLIYPDLKKEILSIFNEYNPVAILIENKSNGSSLIQDLQQQYNKIISIKPTKSKEYRVNEILTTIESGSFFIAEKQSWNESFEAELLSFPSCKHDDIVDAVSQMINWYNNRQKYESNEIRIREI